MITVRKERCPQNHPCPTVRVCPTQAIVQHGNGAPVIDESRCIHCCKCVRSCSAFVGSGRCG